MVFFSDVSGLLTSDGGDMGMVVRVISGEVSNGTVISGESSPMPHPLLHTGIIFHSERKDSSTMD